MSASIASRAVRRLQELEAEAIPMVVMFAALMLGLIWINAFHLISVERSSAEQSMAESSRELVETYEAQVVRSLGAIDQTLKTVKYAYELNVTSPFTLADLNEKGLLPPALIFNIRVADTRGNIIAGTRAGSLENIVGQPYFFVHVHHDKGTPFVGQTMQNGSGEYELSFSRRLNGPAGVFDGVVVLSVDPAYFTSGYERSRLGEQGILGLLGEDGIFRVRRSGENVSAGDIVDLSIYANLDSGPEGGGGLVRSPWDNVQRYSNLRRLRGFPLIAIAGLSEQEELNEYHQRRGTYLREAAIASAILLAIVVVLVSVLSQLARNRRRIHEVQETYYAASEASLDSFFLMRSIYGPDRKIVDFEFHDMNSRGERLIGTSRNNILGKRLCELFPKSRKNGVLDELIAVATTGEVREKEWRNHVSAVQAQWLYREVVRVQGGVVAIVRDITERKRTEILRTEEGRVLEMIASSTPLEDVLLSIVQLIESQLPEMLAAIRLMDDEGMHLRHAASRSLIESYTAALDRMFIGATSGTCGAAIHRCVPVVTADIETDPLWETLRSNAAAHGLRSCWSTPILDIKSKPIGTLALYSRSVHEPDAIERQVVELAARLAGIAIERRQAEERIRHMAHHDALTGVPNRNLLDDRLKQAMLLAQRYDRSVLVVLIDLDNFKLINDSLGHNVGDELLKTVAERMVGAVRRTDTVARMGGDEFVVVLCDNSDYALGVRQAQVDAERMVPTLEKIRDAIARPVTIGENEIHITCSMGVTAYPHDGKDIFTLLKNADAAMYRAKELGHDRCQFYTAEMNSQIHERLSIQDGLRNAIVRDEFQVHYQPQVDVRTGRIFGAEALLRWDRPGHGMVPPSSFIPLAEETGQIVPMGDWVLHTACRQAMQWQASGLSPIVVAVNVSARQFRDGHLVERVRHALAETGLAPCYLELEVTESLIMQDLQRALDTMRELKAMDVHLSIDDFGTGYSSLSSLKSFPISRLKIDRSFVHDLSGSNDGKVIATAIISLGHKLNLRVIAEGVETDEQFTFLRENHCDEIQGYYFSKPITSDKLATLLREEMNQLACSGMP